MLRYLIIKKNLIGGREQLTKRITISCHSVLSWAPRALFRVCPSRVQDIPYVPAQCCQRYARTLTSSAHIPEPTSVRTTSFPAGRKPVDARQNMAAGAAALRSFPKRSRKRPGSTTSNTFSLRPKKTSVIAAGSAGEERVCTVSLGLARSENSIMAFVTPNHRFVCSGVPSYSEFHWKMEINLDVSVLTE